ncbi:efflux RND transporter permease subunit [Bradymonas sediminis]|uniref:AcrB/AcrD/AcrF family protein n=1 Tax=Bradymonas sediminis TaxID=1548548 RepID=A0A2Z4FIG2_9DELT|nr:efflux RND transporter permease subunit [Bradymonas sediminis]AWV88680.1 AcrB/AcrD/AcrF family protein [Bradymonas sediminis]TDP63632.1 Cu(I)/Ag(I) efflux system membrane protein CusA/SilA [Bradymonas sediminis]
MRTNHEPKSGWEWLLDGLLRQKLVIFIGLVLVVVWGSVVSPFDLGLGFERDPVPVDAIPDIGENQQIVFVEWAGRSPQDMQDQVTYPLTVALQGIPEVKTIRSFSMAGFTSIYIIFNEGADFYWTRARIVEKLASLPPNTLPPGVAPQLGPDATALGQIYWYTLEGRDPDGNPVGGWDLNELRTLQDFHVRFGLASAQGVAEVASIGGFVQEYQIDVDPAAMRSFNVTLEDIAAAVGESNAEVGAQTTEINGVDYMVRGIGFVRSVDDIAESVVKVVDHAPVRIRDVAKVGLGPAERDGALTKGGVEAVGGVVTARYGSNPRAVIDNVKEALAEVQQSLPSRVLEDGTVSQVTIVPFYDRTELIERTLGTLSTALYQQVMITILVVLVMLLHIRSSLLITILLPFAVLLTFIAMKYTGVDANVVALGGIAIAIGTVVDMGIIMTENIVQHLEMERDEPPLVSIRRGAAEVAPAVLTAIATTVISFLPVFMLTGQAGKLFGPLAYTKTYALLASLVVAIVVIPPLAYLLMGLRFKWFQRLKEGKHARQMARVGQPVFKLSYVVIVLFVATLLALSWMPLGAGQGEFTNVLFVCGLIGGLLGSFWLFRLAYVPILRWVLAHKLVFLSVPVAIVFFGTSAWLGFGTLYSWLPEPIHKSAVGQWLHHELPGLDREFMPALDEGMFLYMPSTMPHSSIGEAVDMVAQLDLLFETVPEVEYAVGKIGRSASPLDPAPITMVETIIAYQPEYRVDAAGKRLLFRVGDDGEFVRDADGELIEDAGGKAYRNWRPEINRPEDIWDALVAVGSKLPGMTSAPMLQPISTRIVMLSSGINAPIAVRLRGPNLEVLGDAALKVQELLREHPMVNTQAVNADRPVGKPYIEIRPDRAKLARYGVTMASFQNTVDTAIGGRTISQSVEGRERFSIRLRYPREMRDVPESMERVFVTAKDGVQIPIGDLAQIDYVRGPEMVRSEDTYLVSYVMFDGKGDAGEVDVVESVRASMEAAIASGELELAEGVSYSFAGSYENSVKTEKKLTLLIPIVLLVIFMLIYMQFRSVLTGLMIFSGIFVAFGGGFILLWLYGQPWFLDFAVLGTSMRDIFQIVPVKASIAVWVGFIALFGIASDDGVVMATYLKQHFEEGEVTSVAEIRDRVVEAGERRIRPCLMTSATTILALLPVLTSYGAGADVMIPMALPAVGGMSVALVTLFVVPVLYSAMEEFKLRFGGR